MAYVEAADVSVVVVNYNTKVELRRCIDSIDPVCEIIVVDNASQDGSVEMLREEPRIRLIESSENVGFGPGNNLGIAVASRPLVLLLNSDAWVTAGAIVELAKVFEDEQVVAAGGRLLNPDGTTQESCSNELNLWAVFCEQLWLEKLLRRSRVFSPYWMSSRLLSCGDGAQPVGQVMGACLMFRPVERFDERFFLYCEDTELCYRLRQHGKILYAPGAKFYHELGVSSGQFRWRAVAMYNCGKELYFKIHRGGIPSLTCWLLDRTGAFLRLVCWLLATMGSIGTNEHTRSQVVTFWKVLTAPSGYAKVISKGRG